MEVIVLNPDLESIGVLDTFESLIWTDRYYSCGDFEITKSPSSQFIQTLNDGLYLNLKESEHAMLIEYINIHSDSEKGRTAIVKGRSLESILNRRIIWYPTVLTGSFQSGIETLLNENAINPSDLDRKISRLEFVPSVDPAITNLTIDSQFWGENLYEVIGQLCISRNVGFKITITDLGKFRFELYSGIDRSYDQLTNPYVVFSPNFENLINGDYIATNQILKTVTLVAGEQGVGNARNALVVSTVNGAGADLARREMFTDAKGITRNVPNGEPLTDIEYAAQLEQKGYEDLAKNTFIQSFEGQVDTNYMYIYGRDFFMGDILQVSNEYGNEAKSRVTELIRSQDPAGIRVYPTFSTLEQS